MKKVLYAALMLPLIFAISGCGGKKAGSDKDILTLIYQQAGGDSWEEMYKENWCSDEEIGKWHNVRVNDEGRVTELTIYGSGKIPAEISGLTELQNLVISLDNNRLEQKVDNVIPAGISELTKLQGLHIDVRGAEYSIPDLSAMKSLKHLHLSVPEEAPFPDLTGMTSLDLLSIRGGKGQIPESYYELTGLRNFNLTTNNLEGGVSPKIANLKNLEALRIEHAPDIFDKPAPDAALPEEIFTMTNLKSLGLKKVSTSGTIPTTVGNMAQLKGLSIQECGLTGEIPEEIGKLTNLSAIYLQRNNLTGPIPEAIGSLKSLRTLWLQKNQLTGAIPESLASLTELDMLDLSDNQFDAEIPESLKAHKNFGKFRF